MSGWGAWACVVAAAALAACNRGDGSDPAAPSPSPREAVASASPSAVPLAIPVAPVASAEPPATPTAEASAASRPIASYLPRDECARLPGFPALREKVFAAVAKRDGEALAALANPGVHLDFGGGAGREELVKRLADPRSALWDELAALAALGCAADGTVATMPAIFSRVPDDVDAARTMLVTGTAVPLRAKPSPSAATLRTLDWALVTLEGQGFDPAARYAEVTAADGSRGFVATAKLRSILDYRLIADKAEGGEYRITALIAGD